MAFSYSGDPSDSNLDAVRFLIKDTNSAAYDLEDAEIEWLITQEGNIYRAAVEAASAILARLRSLPDIRTGVVHIKNEDRMLFLSGLIERLRLKATVTTALPFAGGISIADKETREADTDRVMPSFTRTTHAPPGEALGVSISRPLTDID